MRTALDNPGRSASRVESVGGAGAGRIGGGRRGASGGGRMRWSRDKMAKSGGGCGEGAMRGCTEGGAMMAGAARSRHGRR
jgi:hypothetical protein